MTTTLTRPADGEGSVQEGDEVEYRAEYDDRKGKDMATRVARIGGGRGERSRSQLLPRYR